MKAHGMYELRPLSREEWRQGRENLLPGANVLVVTNPLDYYHQACFAEDAGFELRDCITVLTPTGYLLVVVAMKPLDGTFVENALEHGVAGYNIDGSRVSYGSRGPDRPFSQKVNTKESYWGTKDSCDLQKYSTDGRYPSNVILMHHPDCQCVGTKKVKPSNGSGRAYEGGGDHENDVYGKGLKYRSGIFGIVGEDGTETVDDWECAEGCPVKALDEQTEDRIHGAGHARDGTQAVVSETYEASSYMTGPNRNMHRFGDSGGASRFFKQVQRPENLHHYLTTLICPPPKATGSLTLLTSLPDEHTPFDTHLNWESLT